MNCQDTQTLIQGYLDGELDLVNSLQLERHLQECPACAHVYENHQTLQSGLRDSSLYFAPPAGLRGRIHSALREADQAERRASRRTVGWSIPWRPAWRPVSVAASLVFLAVLSWRLAPMFSRPSPDELLAQEVLASHVRSLMANHLTDVPSSDQHTVKPWFNGKLDFSPPVRDLSSEGFPLVGGRLDYLEDRPVAALVYQRRKHYINLFVWLSAGQSGRGTVMRQGYNLLHWTQSGMTYWAVSDLNYSELEEFAQLVRNGRSRVVSP